VGIAHDYLTQHGAQRRQHDRERRRAPVPSTRIAPHGVRHTHPSSIADASVSCSQVRKS